MKDQREVEIRDERKMGRSEKKVFGKRKKDEKMSSFTKEGNK